MKILLVGATGTIGSAVATALLGRHEVVCASRRRSALKVDLASQESIAQLYATVGRVDAVVCTAGRNAYGPLVELTDADFALGLGDKLMGAVNLLRQGIEFVTDGGSFTLTSGIASRRPMPGGALFSLVNAGIEGFVRAAALEVPRGIRVNAVAPGWVRETLEAMGRDANAGLPAAQVARSYVAAVEGRASGEVIDCVARSI
jgi:NAD(P)-dependent dehydrogenase (short-subunit alcohol dehydrogenase family)